MSNVNRPRTNGPHHRRNSMASDSQVYREEFDTEAEAIAFTEGIDFMDYDHVSYEGPYEENDKWVVEVTKFC
jgi:hypothetical protein